MIDPKFNELPIDESTLTEEERVRRRKSELAPTGSAVAARGLSINDTIARDANFSVGARGVNVSGVSAGSGAGAGSTMLTPTPTESAVPEIVPGSRGTGMTPLANAPYGETSTDRLDGDLDDPALEGVTDDSNAR